MTPAEIEFYQAFLSTFGVAALCSTVAWWRARKRAIRAEAQVAALRVTPDQAGLQHAVEAIAIEVERIGEGQRYIARALHPTNPDEPSAGTPGNRVVDDSRRIQS